MQKEKHPKYQTILYVDTATGHKFLCGSTLQPKGTEKFEGKEYPVFYLPTSSYSHPFFTGSSQLVDAEGRVEKFRNRYASAQKKKEPTVEKKEEKPEAAPAKAKKAKKQA